MSDRPARVFFALWPDAATAATIHATGQTLINGGRPVARPDLHLTLAFSGRVTGAQVVELKALAGAVDLPAFTLKLDRPGYFDRPGIVWLGPSHIPMPLLQLVEWLSPARSAGVTRKGNFRPHVTLARRAPKPEATAPVPAIDWPVRKFALVESGHGGVAGAYTQLHQWPLRAAGSYGGPAVE